MAKQINTKKEATEKTLRALKVLSNQSRLEILMLLFEARGNPCVGDIADTIGLSQSATSHQLARLEAWGVIEGERQGQAICYHPTDTDLAKRVKRIINALA